MKYISVCSGIEAATTAWHHMGWKPVAFSEIEPFPSAVLAHHYPNTPNLGDMTNFKEWPNESIDLIVGGTPCQSFSVAGLRKGLDDPRGNLMLTYLAIAERYRPEWLVWENVPGVLSSNGGRDFGTFLGALAQLGYGFAYRVLDAQYFGVAQRRRRVFVVANARNWRRAAAVLFDSESLRGNLAPSRKTGKDTSGSTGDGIARCITTGEMKRQDWETCNMVAQPIGFGAQMSNPQTDLDLMQTLNAKNPMAVAFAEVGATLKGGSGVRGYPDPSDGNGHNIVAQPVTQFGEIAGSLTARHDSSPCADRGQNVVAQLVAPSLTASNDPSRSPQSSEVTQQVAAIHAAAMQVRRLTPVECERLQGFPDNYTNIPWRKKPESPDGPRYKALGNSMAVPVMRWIGQRIAEVTDASLD